MTSRERVLMAVAHQAPDRIPVDFWARTDVTRRLIEHLGLDDEEALYRRFDIDIRSIRAAEHHPRFEARTTGVLGGDAESSGGRFVIHDDGTYENAWGVVKRLGKDELYEEWVSGPFVDSPDLDAFDWPGIDGLEAVESLRKRCDDYGGQFALMGRLNLPFKIAWHMRGFENFLCDMLVDPEFAKDLLGRVAAYEKEKGLRLVRAGVDIVGIYGDIAMQDRMLVHPAAWRAIEKPVLADMIAAFKAENPEIVPFYHSDGNIMEVIPDLIEIGFEILNPIQPECMDPAEVKRRFGDRIAIHGTISLQETMPKGTVEDVRREVWDRIETCGKGGGFILCPSNVLQNDTPFENIVALYDSVGEYYEQKR